MMWAIHYTYCVVAHVSAYAQVLGQFQPQLVLAGVEFKFALLQGFYHALRSAAVQGNQLTSTSSAHAISSLLRNGCRVVELDVPRNAV